MSGLRIAIHLAHALRATEIASSVASALLERNGVGADQVQRVIGGIVVHDITESNPARIVAKRVGVPDAHPAFSVQMQCCSGTALEELERRDKETALITMCIGGGMGVATIIEGV